MFIFYILAILILIYWLSMIGLVRQGLALMHELPLHKKLEEEPLVSVIMVAKEEETTVEQTVKHLLAQDYANMELIVINDRLREQTEQKLEALKAWSAAKEKLNKRIQVIHITQVPDGWLGKNHALYQGYLQAKGKYLLFTDADVFYNKHALSSAIHYMQKERLDHLTLIPTIKTNSFWLKSFLPLFFFSFVLYVLPWRANLDGRRKHGLGIGAFNLLTREAYERIGTHKRLALRPDEAWQLGREVKRAGLKQRLLTGLNHLQVEPFPDLASARHVLEKNTFFDLQQRFMFFLYTLWNFFIAFLFPFVGLWLFWGSWLSIFCGLSLSLAISLYLAFKPINPFR